MSVCGLPEATLRKVKGKGANGRPMYEVELLGFDVFDPVTMEAQHRRGHDVPAWLLDTDYNGLSFDVSQTFFPRTGAWENLKRALRGIYEDSVWDHLAGTVSAPFEAGEHGQIAVKVIDDGGSPFPRVQLRGKVRMGNCLEARPGRLSAGVLKRSRDLRGRMTDAERKL